MPTMAPTYKRTSSILVSLTYCLVVGISLSSSGIVCDQIQLNTILPKLRAIHEDSKTLLIKNSELKSKILIGLQAQNEARLKLVKAGGALITSTSKDAGHTTVTKPNLAPPSGSLSTKPMTRPTADENGTIDYAELEEFNKWVDSNLEYAVKNTQASIEAFKEEAQQNNGNVDYSEQAIHDGIEGVKYWQSAVIFQDKTLKNEKFVSD